MQVDPIETAGGMRWFFGAGLFAVALSFVLYKTDNMLTYSPRERNLGATLKELRGAQFGLTTRDHDDRLRGVSGAPTDDSDHDSVHGH